MIKSPKKRGPISNKVPQGVFAIEISEAKDLVGSKGITDVYAKIQHEGILGKHKWTTSTKHKTTTPKWDNECCTGYILDSVDFSIKIRVFDDEGQSWKSDECLGEIILTVSRPTEFLEGWYPLSGGKKFKCRGGQVKIALSLKYGASCVQVLERFQILHSNTQNPLPLSVSSPRSSNPKPIKQGTIFDYIKRNDALSLLAFLRKCKPADVNDLDTDGNSPLHLACLDCQKLDRRILHGLLNFRGINLNISNNSQNSPLHYFCGKWEDPNLDLLDLFIAQGADINAVNAGGETPLFKAIANNSIRKPLITYLLKKGADPTKVNSKGDRLLHYAARMGRSDIVGLILQYSDDINIKGAGGLTPAEICEKYAQEQEDEPTKAVYLSIKSQLKTISELFEFLDSNGLSCDKPFFVKHRIDLNTMLNMDEDALLDLLDLPLGRKYKLLSSIKKKKEEQPTRTLEEKLAAMREKNSRKQKPNAPTMETLMSELKAMGAEKTTSNIVFIQHSQLEFLDELGRGAFGVVYKGLLKVAASPPVEVAIKCLLQQGQEEIDDFKKEFQVLHAVTHPNVVGFFGVCLEGSPSLIMEYCSLGSLNLLLKDPRASWKWPDFFRVAKGSINGLLALHNHTPQILHRDLKSLNLLMCPGGNVKVADFGLSREITASSDTLKALQGTAHYMAPEVLLGGKFTAKADVYSLGIILWEVIHRVIVGSYQSPYEEYPDIAGPASTVVLLLKVSSGLRPSVPEATPEIISKLLSDCLTEKLEQRLEVHEVLAEIEQAEREFQEAKSEAWSLFRRSIGSDLLRDQNRSKSTGAILQKNHLVISAPSKAGSDKLEPKRSPKSSKSLKKSRSLTDDGETPVRGETRRSRDSRSQRNTNDK